MTAVVDIRIAKERGHRYLDVEFANGHVYDPALPLADEHLPRFLDLMRSKSWCTPEVLARINDTLAAWTAAGKEA